MTWDLDGRGERIRKSLNSNPLQTYMDISFLLRTRRVRRRSANPRFLPFL
jgi:hypothetical protein